MKQFFDEIRLEVIKAVKQDVKKILNQIGKEQIYGAALVTDSDCITLYFAVNTYEKMREKDLKYMNMFQAHMTEEQIERLKNGTLSMTKWVPAEWAYSAGRESELNNISKLLYQKEEANSAEYSENTALFFEAVTEAWRMLIIDKIFGEKTEDITYFVSMSDDNRSETIENYSASQLNRQELYEAFLKRAEERV